MMRVLFMGTPEIAAACLQAVLDAGHTVVGVFCQPDKPVGRKQVLTPPPAKVLAEAKGIPVFQPTTLKDGAAEPILRELSPDVCVVVAYGKILPAYVLQFPKYGCLNLHVSLLPMYRGAAPMQRAIMAGERETGVTVMYMDEGLDTGDILSVTRFPIEPTDDFGSVSEKSARIGGVKLTEALAALEAGNAPRTPQPAGKTCYAAKITKEDCVLDFGQTAEEVLCRIRGLSPAPLAFTHTPDGKMLKILAALPGEGEDAYGRVPVTAEKEKCGTAAGATGAEAGTAPASDESGAEAGTVLALDESGSGAVTVACGVGTLRLTRLLPEGKSAMNAADFIRGRKITVGDKLG